MPPNRLAPSHAITTVSMTFAGLLESLHRPQPCQPLTPFATRGIDVFVYTQNTRSRRTPVLDQRNAQQHRSRMWPRPKAPSANAREHWLLTDLSHSADPMTAPPRRAEMASHRQSIPSPGGGRHSASRPLGASQRLIGR